MRYTLQKDFRCPKSEVLVKSFTNGSWATTAGPISSVWPEATPSPATLSSPSCEDTSCGDLRIWWKEENLFLLGRIQIDIEWYRIRRKFIKAIKIKARSHDLGVQEGDLKLRGRGFESWRLILDGKEAITLKAIT